MERLWSPWRFGYVTGANPASGRVPECIFCDAGGSPNTNRADLVLVRGRLSYVVLNLYPYNNGHLMVAPNRHVASLAGATADELSEMMRFTRDAELALTEAYQPQGINAGINIGRPAGAGIVGHLHIHMVPRWAGDTSFMSVIGETRVLPETMADTAKRLRPIFERLYRDGNGEHGGNGSI
jgi:ATP adenylyltransferase